MDAEAFLSDSPAPPAAPPDSKSAEGFLAEPATSAAPATPQTDSFVNPFGEPKLSVPSAVAPKPDAPKKKSLGDRAYSFLEEGGLGAALGAITPELTTGAGMALSAFPLTAPIGVTLTGVGSAMKGTRVLQAGLGLASGLSGEAAAQTAELFKQPEKVQEIARLAAGAVTPELGSLVKFAAKKLITGAGFASARPHRRGRCRSEQVFRYHPTP